MDIYSHHRAWLCSPHLAVFSQKRPRTGIAGGLQVTCSLAKFCGEVCAVPVYALMLSILYFPEYKNNPKRKIYILCVNVCIIFDGRFLVDCQIPKFLYSPSEGIIYKARCQLLQLFFMAFQGGSFC